MTGGYAHRTVTHTYAGHTLTISLQDPMAAGWYDCDKETPAEFPLMRQHGLKPGATVFNLGAFQGVVALMLAAEVGPTGHVLAVEGNPHNAALAETNRCLNPGLEARLQVIHGAVTGAPGFVNFATEFNGRIDDRGRLGNAKVRAFTIDELADEHGLPDLVYMDIEGYELEALRGASRVLAEGDTTWSIEVHPHVFAAGHPEDLLELLAGRQIWIAADTSGGPGLRYERFSGGQLPLKRFFVIAAP
jgi:FkbM family methyltransferase